jgi:hypothetical protein
MGWAVASLGKESHGAVKNGLAGGCFSIIKL